MQKLAIVLLALVLVGSGCAKANAPQVSTPVVEPPATTTPMNNENLTPQAEPKPASADLAHPGVLQAERIEGKQVRITTAKGDIVFELYPETAPNTVSNFVYLTDEGYYNGLNFHRREEGFVIQGGDPNGNGSGGPGYTFADELQDDLTYERGIVAMANRGPNTNGSQFFIMLEDTGLPKLYSIFGRVTEGLDIVDQIQVGDIMSQVVVENKE